MASYSAAAANIINLPHHLSKIHKNTKIHSLFTSRRYANNNMNFNARLICTVSSGTGKITEAEQSSTPAKTKTEHLVEEGNGGWAEFAERVSGEWDGFGADFDKDAKPVELPEYVVPQAYREWDVQVFDWQTQCPTLALPQHLSLTYKLIKLLPTVGCEADAATRYTIDERNINNGNPPHSHSDDDINKTASAFAYQSTTGCYVAIWPVKKKDDDTVVAMEVEHCLIDPRDRESRVRIIQVVRRHDKLELQSIRVFREQWYGPFRNGDQLGGCAIRDSAFASTQPLNASQLIGSWQPQLQGRLNASASQNNKVIQELADDKCVHTLVVRDERDLKLLPKQLWCSLRELEDGDICCEAGWLLYVEHAITSQCIFSSNVELKEIRVACETRAMSQQ